MIIRTEIDIAAPPIKVWRTLCEFGTYHTWNPYYEVRGVARPGEKVTLRIGLNGERRRKTEAIITNFEPGRSLSFKSRRFFSTAMESFVIEPGTRGTLLHHTVEITGPIVVFTRGRWFDANMRSVYILVNKALNKHLTAGKVNMSARNRRRTGR